MCEYWLISFFVSHFELPLSFSFCWPPPACFLFSSAARLFEVTNIKRLLFLSRLHFSLLVATYNWRVLKLKKVRWKYKAWFERCDTGLPNKLWPNLDIIVYLLLLASSSHSSCLPASFCFGPIRDRTHFFMRIYVQLVSRSTDKSAS